MAFRLNAIFAPGFNFFNIIGHNTTYVTKLVYSPSNIWLHSVRSLVERSRVCMANIYVTYIKNDLSYKFFVSYDL